MVDVTVSLHGKRGISMFRNLMLAAACLMSPAVHAEWQEASSRHFVVYANDTPEKVRTFTTRLERYDAAMRVFRVRPDQGASPARRVTVYVVKSVDDIQRLFGRGGSSVAGFYQPRASGSVAFVPAKGSDDSIYALDAQSDLFHEYAHHFMYLNYDGAAFPYWFTEGFAEFHATAMLNKDGSITFGGQPLYRAYGIDAGNILSVPRMLTAAPGQLSARETSVLYARSWALMHFLTFDPDRRKELGAYVGAVNSGKSPAEAAKAISNLSTLDFKLDTYVRRSRLPVLTVPAAEIPDARIVLRALTPGEAATMPARIRSNRGVDDAGARQVVALAQQGAAAFPTDPGAQNVLAEAEYDAKNYTAAQVAAERAIAADPNSIHAIMYHGMAMQALAVQNKATDPATWQQIRKQYLRANKLDSDDPQPLILYYESFGAARQAPTANAEAGLLYAQKLAPFDLGLRYTAAKILLRQNKPEEARVAIEGIAFYPHGGAGSEAAGKVLAALNATGPAAALALMEQQEKEARDKAKTAKTPGAKN